LTVDEDIVGQFFHLKTWRSAVIHLQTLGGLDLRGPGGESLAAVTSRPREMGLLIYLASAGPGAFRRRDTVLAMFWPESPEDRARHTLNQMLYRLRRTLGDEVLVSRGQDDIGTNAGHLRCDAADFRQALEEARWEDALTVYRGPFLPGFFVSGAPDLERWIDEERQAHRRGARDAATALSEQLEKEGDLREAADWARRAWEIEPASDSLLRRPLTLLHRLGERSEALVLFESFRRRMAAEYGLEPSAETLELVARIRAAGAEGREPGGPPPVAAAVSGITPAPVGGALAVGPASRRGRGLGGTLAGAGAALVGAAAVAWVFLSSGNVTPQGAHADSTVPVVVVLPVAVSGPVSPDYGDLGRALTTELTNRLGEVPGLFVVPPESVEPYLDEEPDLRAIGRQFQGNAIVESRLHWEPSGVETSSRVTDVLTGETIWGATHSYPHNEILNAQLDLTVGLTSALNVRMAILPDRDLTFSSDEELRAWSLVSRAWDTIAGVRGVFPAETEEAARGLIQRALAIEPEYAPAYAVLSRVYRFMWRWNRGDVARLDSAVAAAERAVALDPDHYLAHLSLAQALGSASVASPERYPPRTTRRRAEAALRAVQLNPGSPECAGIIGASFSGAKVGRGLLWAERAAVLRRDWEGIQNNRTHAFWLLGDYDAAIEAYRLVTELDLEDPHPRAFRIPEYNLSRGRLNESRRQIEAVRIADPQRVATFPVLIYLELMEGNYEAAEDLIEELLSREPPVKVIGTSNFFSRTALGYVYLKTGRVRESRRLLEMVRDRHLDLIETGQGYTGHYDLARVYAMLGEPEQANHWLQVAIDRGWPFYYTEMGRTDPMLENLRGNEGFERIMDELKAKLDAEREWVREMLALPEPERFHAMLMDAEEQLEVLWEAQGAG
jgi:DNA-binding SARP family transcriptional activator/TolB-like protein